MLKLVKHFNRVVGSIILSDLCASSFVTFVIKKNPITRITNTKGSQSDGIPGFGVQERRLSF